MNCSLLEHPTCESETAALTMEPTEQAEQQRQRDRLDWLGATLSFACAVHCMLQPLLLLALPMVGLGFLMNEQIETVFLGFTLVLATVALTLGYRHHHNPITLILLALGAILIVASRLPAGHDHEVWLAVSGALSITASHLVNQYAYKQCEHPKECEPVGHSHIH